MKNAITVENLSKSYLLNHKTGEAYLALRDVIANATRKISRKIFHPFDNAEMSLAVKKIEEFWALKDVNFEIKQGERVGIIGRNGAGKSTLLKILSRITEPTKGKIAINGRVASLLEVGTGFHPELTGRENIFLNGAILGMGKAEIKRKFDEIVDFAEVEKFLDTPVKRYSSGMYVRLAFSVAAHLEPEILIVDEVLAVGDASFQKKCMGRMEEVGKEGRTVIFVSHNMGSVSQLCNKGVFLKNGSVEYKGDVSHAVQLYLATSKEQQTKDFPVREDLYTYISRIEVCDENRAARNVFDINDKVVIRIHYKATRYIKNHIMVLTLYRNGTPVFHTYSTDFDNSFSEHMEGSYIAECVVKNMFLKPGAYHVDINTSTHELDIQNFRNAISFDVEATSIDLTSKGFRSNRLGDVVFQGNWGLTRC